MPSYDTTCTTAASPASVMAVLTDPAAIRDWSPVPFEVEGCGTDALRAGMRTRVKGSLAGFDVGFDVHVRDAADDLLRIGASGPIDLDVTYRLRPVAGGSEIAARVDMRRPSGLASRVISKATETLLAAGALDGAAFRIAGAAERSELAPAMT